MGRSINSGTITKKAILESISQITIFSTYFDLPANVIQHCIDTGELILSPIRLDRHPTVGFRYDNKGKLKMRDFGGYFWGDCFDAVAFILSQSGDGVLNINKKEDFVKVLRHIAYTFSDIFYGIKRDENLPGQIKANLEIARNKKPIIELVVRNWNEDDQNYWNQFGINLQYLNINFVYPIDQYYINRNINPEPKYFYNPKDPCYAYFLGKDKQGINSIKLYFPKRPHGTTRFITNANHLEGIYNLAGKNYDYIVITKSSKDRMSIGCTLASIFPYGELTTMSIGVINIPHETYRLRPIEYDWLKGKLKEGGKLVSLMDNDRAGICEASYLRRAFNIIPLFIPKDTCCKDFAEYRMIHNNEDTIQIINQAINYIQNYEHNHASWYEKESNSKPF